MGGHAQGLKDALEEGQELQENWRDLDQGLFSGIDG